MMWPLVPVWGPCYRRAMPNVKPIRFSETLHIRVDDDFLARLDALREEYRPLKTRAELIRHLVTTASEKARAAKAKGKGDSHAVR